ncbi:sulfatase family protein [Singulisphaera sp. PoT]|uniref:sulfatase family protein n=1 Tax=Singulisphaera sp. PoT TaxID=3411797 RepID=UPI003BF5FE28
MRVSLLILIGALALALVMFQAVVAGAAAPSRPPNIVYILADDLGLGDVRCYNPSGKIATPNLDRFASQGMRFTDAHSGSAVCTPTRYGILTGRYSWRTSLKMGVLFGYDRPLIEPDRLTVPAFLRQSGYRTACVGKWHLGMDWPLAEGENSDKIATGREVDYSKPIANGPTSFGFDRYFGISASLDMPPYVFIDQDRTVGLPTVEKNFGRKGLAATGFKAEEVVPTLVQSAMSYIDTVANARRSGGSKPFFLYMPLTAPHTPLTPSREWSGKSGLCAYADFVMQVDDAIGQVLASLEASGLAGETLVVVTSDNGYAPQADYETLIEGGHDPSAGFRGTKADIFEGGHRIPFIVRWPGRVHPGTTSDRLICLTDLFATCAEILGTHLPDSAGEDSVSFLPTLLGNVDAPGREAIVHHSINGSFAIRQGSWKLCLCPDSGGWTSPLPGTEEAKGLPRVQLYDLAKDPAERHNLQAERSDVVERLTWLLEKYGANGRSTPGIAQPNSGFSAEIPSAHKR